MGAGIPTGSCYLYQDPCLIRRSMLTGKVQQRYADRTVTCRTRIYVGNINFYFLFFFFHGSILTVASATSRLPRLLILFVGNIRL